MAKVLIVEDTKLFANILRREITTKLKLEVEVAPSLAQAQALLAKKPERFFLGLLDLNLPDAPRGEIVDYVLSQKIPVIVFTGEFNDEMREQMIAKRVIDYVLKEGVSSVHYVVSLVDRINRNRSTKVLVVDDALSARKYIARLLKTYQFIVLEAEDGISALDVLDIEPNIRLALVDYNMPGMDGFELTRKIREKHNRESLAIIGVSAYGNNILSAKFIKHGANDFINKPFLVEEFFCRISQNIGINEYIQALKAASTQDFLTGLHNRRHFLEISDKFFASARRGQIDLTVAAMEVDGYHKACDAFGHDAGDALLRRASEIFIATFRDTDILARFEGGAFCILFVDLNVKDIDLALGRLMKALEGESIKIGVSDIPLTLSAGLCATLEPSLLEMVNVAFQQLRQAQESGKGHLLAQT